MVTYVNWKGVKRSRPISPTGEMTFTSSPWHPVEQWLFGAIDCEDGYHKLFALNGIQSWEE